MGGNVIATSHTKHMDIRYKYVNEYRKDSIVKIVFLQSAENDSNVLTKNAGIPKLPIPSREQRLDQPRGKSRKAYPNCMTDDPKTRDKTDMSMGKKTASSGQSTAQEWLLVTFSNCWGK